jgi:glycosyltransferase involved in cell wall biosynthesis
MPHGYLDPYILRLKRWRKVVYYWAIERRNLLAAKRLIYTTPEEMRLATAEISTLPKGVVVPLGGDAPSSNPENFASKFFERFPKARGRKQLLFLARLDSKKGLDRILMALPSVVKRFPDILLTIVGEGSTEFKAMLNAVITAHGLERNVLLTGWLSGLEKWGAYASAELFLLPSRQENFAITVAEAMHMGVPVVVSNKVNTWPYVRDAGAGFVLDEQGIVGSLEDCILSLLQDRGKLRLMSKAGQEYARKNLTWARATASLLKCYDEVVSCTQSAL